MPRRDLTLIVRYEIFVAPHDMTALAAKALKCLLPEILRRGSVPDDRAIHLLHQPIADEQIQVWNHSMKIQVA
jgi:hypothetical protein